MMSNGDSADNLYDPRRDEQPIRVDDLEIKGGTLYPALSRLETAGLVSTEWRAGDSGPGRKYYELTTPGRAELAERSQGWGGFAGAIAGVLSGARTAPEHSESRETS